MVNTLPCYVHVCSRLGNPFGGVGSNPAGDATFFVFFAFPNLLFSNMLSTYHLQTHFENFHYRHGSSNLLKFFISQLHEVYDEYYSSVCFASLRTLM